MTDLRDKVAALIERSIRVRVIEINGVTTALVDDLNLAADAILAIPKIADALECQSDADYVDPRTQRQRNADRSAAMDKLNPGASI